MFKTIDRYLLREIVVPFVLSLVVLTFLLMIQPILQRAESFIAKGVEFPTVVRALIALMPSSLSLTIPMALLLGILIAFGRLSADREFVALQACGVSLLRLVRPVMLLASVATAATAYQLIVALPRENQRFQEIAANVMVERIDHQVVPRVFYDDFPDHTIYVRDLPPGGGWTDVFVADTARPGDTTVFFAREGRIRLDREKQLVHLELADGAYHKTSLARPDVHETTEFQRFVMSLNPRTVFAATLPKGAPEMTLSELRVAIAEAAKHGDPAYRERFMTQYKFSLPASCPILALVALALGASNRKGGKLGSFVLGSLVILVYYVLFYGTRSMAMGGRMTPEWAPWIPNILMGAAGVALMAWRARSADKPIQLSVPAFWRRGGSRAAEAAAGQRAGGRFVVVIRVPHVDFPRPRLIDRYVSKEYLRVFVLGLFSLLGLFYISTFIDLADKMFRGEATGGMLLRFFFFQTPQFVHYVIPMSVLVSTLVTIGVMTKNSELLVLRACGISLYRTAAPLLLFALAASGVLFLLQEEVLALTSREANRLERVIRGWPARPSPLDQRWRVGESGDIYHYDAFDAQRNQFARLFLYGIDQSAWQLRSLVYVADARFEPQRGADGALVPAWRSGKGWRRDLAAGTAANGEGGAISYASVDRLSLPLGRPSEFTSDVPQPDEMSFAQLSDHIARLQAIGANAVPATVTLHRKVAFPFVTVIMTLLAVPFAVTTGRRGALYGIGAGIIVAITYYVTMIVFFALGTGGVLPPLLAAWAPNLLFGAGAAYLLLTVRT
jgi:LPS export ABC transporter permease LptF